MHHAAYFYLEMHTHELTVPYTNKPRRIRAVSYTHLTLPTSDLV